MFAWTEERVAQFKQLHAAGYTYRVIAEAMGNGLTRNACIGKAHRLGGMARGRQFGPRGSRKPREPKPVPAIAVSRGRRSNANAIGRNGGLKFGVARDLPFIFGRKPKAAQKPRPEPPLPPTCSPVSILKVAFNQCRWPVGATAGPETMFCGAPKEIASYCAWHARIAYQPAESMRARQKQAVKALEEA